MYMDPGRVSGVSVYQGGQDDDNMTGAGWFIASAGGGSQSERKFCTRICNENRVCRKNCADVKNWAKHNDRQIVVQ